MATFTSYKAQITVPDRFAAGYVINDKEAAALNGLMAEFISHKVRAKIYTDLEKGDTASPELVAAAQAFVAEHAPKFEFGATRAAGEPRVTDPVAVEARAIARREVMAAIAKAGLKLQKRPGKDEEPVAAAEGEYAWDRYIAKVAKVMANPKVQAAAKKTVAARQGGDAVEVNLGDDEAEAA